MHLSTLFIRGLSISSNVQAEAGKGQLYKTLQKITQKLNINYLLSPDQLRF